MIDKIEGRNFRLYTQQEILDNFPKEDFYVVFGSSHSAGWCDNGEERLMSKEKNWPSQLEKLLGKPVFNLAVGGTTPQLMLEIVCEFVYYYTQQNAKCLGALIEPRAADYSIMQDKTEQIVSKTNEKYFDMFKHHAIACGRDYHTKTALSNFYNVFNVGRQLSAGSYEKYNDIDKRLVEWIKSTVEHQMMGAYIHFDCLNILMRMVQVLKSHNIPNYTFYWETREPTLDDPVENKRIRDFYYSTMAEYITRGINYIRADNEKYIHKNSFDILTLVKSRVGEKYLKDNTCLCYHFNENVSKVVAEILYEELS